MEAVQAVDGRGRKRMVALAVIVAVIIIGGAAAAWALGRDDASGTGRVKLGAAVDGVQAIPGFPPRWSPATTTVDDSLFVFGGYEGGSRDSRNDGVLVDPTFTTASRLPDAPFDDPLWAPDAVGVDGQVVVVGIRCTVIDHTDNDSAVPNCVPATNAAGVFDVEGNAWRIVKLPRALATVRMGGARALGTTSDGRAIFEFFPFQQETFWSFDPRTDEWRQIPAPGVRIHDACLSGDTLVVMSARYRNNGVILDDDPARAMTPGSSGAGYLGDGYVLPTITSRNLTGSGTWATSAPIEVGVFTNGLDVKCIADGAAVIEPSPTVVAGTYSFADRSWSKPPRPPVSTYFQTQVWTGKDLIFFPTDGDTGRPGLALNPSTNQWRSVTGFPQVMRAAFWGASAILGYAEPLRVSRPADEGGQATTAPAGVYRYEVPAG